MSDTVTATESIIVCAFDCCEQEIRRCRKCNRPYCIMHTSRFSPNFCKECFSNLAVIESKFHRTFQDYDAKTDKLVVRKESCNKWFIDGPDWPFLELWIQELSDAELEILWNFHYFVMKFIEHENDTRKIEQNRTLRELPTPRLITQTVTKKVTRLVQPETPETMRVKWEKMGLDKDTIDMMLAAWTGGKA
jgi:hypothetical protein